MRYLRALDQLAGAPLRLACGPPRHGPGGASTDLSRTRLAWVQSRGSASLTDSRAPRRVPLDVHEAVLPGDRPGSSRREPRDSPRRAAPRRPPGLEAPAGDRAAPRLESSHPAAVRPPARGARGARPRHVPYRALWLAPPLARHRRCHVPALFRHGAERAGRFGADQRDPRSRARTPARGRAATPGRAMWSLGNRPRSRQRPPIQIRSYPTKAPHAASASSATYHRAWRLRAPTG